jgi:hypothetical protein
MSLPKIVKSYIIKDIIVIKTQRKGSIHPTRKSGKIIKEVGGKVY